MQIERFWIKIPLLTTQLRHSIKNSKESYLTVQGVTQFLLIGQSLIASFTIVHGLNNIASSPPQLHFKVLATMNSPVIRCKLRCFNYHFCTNLKLIHVVSFRHGYMRYLAQNKSEIIFCLILATFVMSVLEDLVRYYSILKECTIFYRQSSRDI